MEWHEQWKRVNRWYDRIKDVDEGRLHLEKDSEYYQDNIYAFFQNCYHLKLKLQL